MPDGPSKFLNFLDQLLPFLAVCPPWLKVWVHVLILVNFITIAGLAVYYLSSRESAMESQSLKHFSIESPGNHSEIPLGDDGTWRVSGALPAVRGADVDLQILKLPEGQRVAQTSALKTTSTYDGHWSFESVKFAGLGSYEIRATGSLSGENRVLSVTVTCSDKGAAYQQSIEREKKFRREANIVDLPAVAVDEALPQLQQLQDEFIASYIGKPSPTNEDLQHALAVVNRGLDLFDELLSQEPTNYVLQYGRAFFLKDYAQVSQSLNRPEEAAQALNEALLMFQAAVRQQPQDTNAWNGLGSVFMLKGRPQEALMYVQKAVDLAPDNAYAQTDLATVKRMIAQQAAAAK